MRSAAENAVYFQRCSQLLDILSNAKRLEIVLTLADGEQSVTPLAHELICRNRRFLSIWQRCAMQELCKRDAKDLLSIIVWRYQKSLG